MTDRHAIPTDPQALAEAVADAMWSRDRAAQALGMRIDSVGPGRAKLSMPVRGDMVNGHHICHGGLIFSLADTAFAYACNAYNRNTVASGCNIDFVATGQVKPLRYFAKDLAMTAITGDQELLGTPNYMAPEQVEGGAPDARVDRWIPCGLNAVDGGPEQSAAPHGPGSAAPPPAVTLSAMPNSSTCCSPMANVPAA